MSFNAMLRESQLRFFSIGIVTEDKARGDDYIIACPIEHLSDIDGKLADYEVKHKANAPDVKGVQKNSAVTSKAVLKAKWLPFATTNRISAPDVVKNETVMLWRFADTEEYYWTTLFREPGVRRKESVLHSFGDNGDPLKPWDRKSSYWMEASTHDKSMRVHTGKSDGEPFEYDVAIDAKNGIIEMKDDVGNYFKMESKSGKVTMQATKEILLDAPTIRLKANHVINDAPLVSNTGNEQTAGTSDASPHVNCVH